MSVPPPADVRRIAFLGSPLLAVSPLQALHGAGYEIPLVVSRPDVRRGRGAAVLPSPVKAAALELGLRVSDSLEDLSGVEVDLVVVVAYGRIIPGELLEGLPFVNLHFSLLPRWRGAAPVERAILAGDTHAGVCLMALEEELDTGGVYRCTEVEIDADENLNELRGRLVEIGTSQLLSALGEGFGDPVPQAGEPVYAAKITAADREIDWNEQAVGVHRRVRVGDAFTSFRGKRLKVHRTELAVGEWGHLTPGQTEGAVVGTGGGGLRLMEVQPEGKLRQAAAAWLNGARPSSDDRLGG